MPDSNGNNLRARLQNAKSSLVNQLTSGSPNVESTSKTLPPSAKPTTKFDTKVHHPQFGRISKEFYCSLLRLDANEKIWKPWGYATIALLAVMIVAEVIDVLLGFRIADRMAELHHLQSITTVRQLRGGYVVTSNASGLWLEIPSKILDSNLVSCWDQTYCLRVKKL